MWPCARGRHPSPIKSRTSRDGPQTWEAYTSAAFLQSYFATGGAASALPADTEARAGYLRFFMIDRAVRELDGELNNRVEWIGIPISGLVDLLALR